MKWTTGLSRRSQAIQAFDEAVDQLEVDSPADVDVLLVFFSSHHTTRVDALCAQMRRRFPDAVCMSSNAAGVVGSGSETLEEPSLGVTAGVLPGVDITPMRLEPGVHDTADFNWHDHPQLDASDTPHFLLLSDPQSFDTESFLAALDRDFPASKKFGGLIANVEEATQLILEGHVFEGGAVGLAFGGELEVDTMVAQACRPIGEPLIVTSHTKNIIHRFDRGNPMEVFRATVGRLEGEDRELASHSMYVGMGVDVERGEYRPGDFLIRDILGFNPKRGDLAVAAAVHDLDVIQFHLMDAHTSEVEFDRLVDAYSASSGGGNSSRGALLFSCVERGEDFYGRPNHESDTLRERLGQLPVGGCFCEGEIGQIQGKTFLHGYASSVAIFRKPGA